MSIRAQNEFQSTRRSLRPESGASHRRRPLSVLFVHRDADVVDSCVEELKKARFIVSADLVLTVAQRTQQLRSQTYDVVVAPRCSGFVSRSTASQLVPPATS